MTSKSAPAQFCLRVQLSTCRGLPRESPQKGMITETFGAGVSDVSAAGLSCLFIHRLLSPNFLGGYASRARRPRVRTSHIRGTVVRIKRSAVLRVNEPRAREEGGGTIATRTRLLHAER